VAVSDEISGLEAQLEVTTDALKRVDLLNDLALALRESDPQRGRYFGQQACELAERQGYQKGIATGLLRLSEINSRLGDCAQALPQAIKALSAFESLGDMGMHASALLAVGVIYGDLGNQPDALHYALKALRTGQECRGPSFKAHVLNNIGAIYNSMGDYVNELKVYEQAYEIYKELGNAEGQAAILNNMAMAYRSLKDWTNALDRGRQSLDLAQATLQNVMLEALVLCTLGDIHLDMADHDQALSHLQQSISLSRKTGFKNIEMCALLSTGKVYLAKREAGVALPYLNQALEITAEKGAPSDLIACQQGLAEAHRQQGNLEEALGYYEQLCTTQQNLAHDEIARKIANLRVIHETETAQQEAVIHRLKNVELEQEMSRREEAEAQLRQYASELETRNAELDAFAHTVAHDLKGPLTAVLGAGSALHKFPDLPDGKRRQLLQAVLEGGRWMKGIVDALLLLASVRGKGKVDTSRLDMVHLVRETRQRMALLVEERRAEIVLPETLPAAVGYGPWVEEVWANYLSNAVKYGGTPPQIEVGGTVQADGLVRFWVHDNGPGLNPEQQERLFIPFERMHSVNAEGHGLGLSIVRRIVEKLGGKIGVSSNVGKGSTFYFTLPAADDSPNPA